MHQFKVIATINGYKKGAFFPGQSPSLLPSMSLHWQHQHPTHKFHNNFATGSVFL